MGYPLVEAMTIGKPVLAIDLPYARAVCKDAALYFDRRVADQAVSMVLRLKNDRELRESLTKKGYERTANMPTWREMGWQYLTLLKNEVKRAKEESNKHGSEMGEGGEQLLS
jgi:glycosyltransferase involved in cell wall biosynthesis